MTKLNSVSYSSWKWHIILSVKRPFLNALTLSTHPTRLHQQDRFPWECHPPQITSLWQLPFETHANTFSAAFRSEGHGGWRACSCNNDWKLSYWTKFVRVCTCVCTCACLSRQVWLFLHPVRRSSFLRSLGQITVSHSYNHCLSSVMQWWRLFFENLVGGESLGKAGEQDHKFKQQQQQRVTFLVFLHARKTRTAQGFATWSSSTHKARPFEFADLRQWVSLWNEYQCRGASILLASLITAVV